jgi:hypothetical protein
MLSQREETEILNGIDTIMYNMKHVPIDDVAYFLVKFDPKLAEKLADAIEFNFLDKEYKNVR